MLTSSQSPKKVVISISIKSRVSFFTGVSHLENPTKLNRNMENTDLHASQPIAVLVYKYAH